MRHFQTDWNAAHLLQGRTDRPLTSEARSRLEKLTPPPPWDAARLIATPLSRSSETARLLTEREPEIESGLIELSWGAWEGRTGADLLADASSGYDHVETWGWTKAPPGGESPNDAWVRIQPVLAGVAALKQPALLVIHRGIMRVIMAKAWGWNFDSPEPFRIKRERIYPIEIDDLGMPVGHRAESRLIERQA